MSVRVSTYGDAALLATSVDGDRGERWRAAHALAEAVRRSGIAGIETILPTFDTLLVEFDPAATDRDALQAVLHGLDAPDPAATPPAAGRTWTIPVAYGGANGPDLADVAAALDLRPRDVVEQHVACDWHVAFNGAPAGAPMQEGGAFDRPIARMPEPRRRVPAGSVALAGLQCVIYAVEAPGGWRLIGRTPVRLVAPERAHPLAIAPGDTLRYRAISDDELAADPGGFLGDRPDLGGAAIGEGAPT